MTASFLLADLGIAYHPREDHVAYVASWLRVRAPAFGRRECALLSHRAAGPAKSTASPFPSAEAARLPLR
ncbi:hypothetical protein [Bradyrhizobium sp.]|uniref:hypothetical protein n=1 Tax=Bradyrhizobium sp. TaxID=376 RepID=UPI0040379A89